VTPRSLAHTTRSIPVKYDSQNEQADGLQKTIAYNAKKILISLRSHVFVWLLGHPKRSYR